MLSPLVWINYLRETVTMTSAAVPTETNVSPEQPILIETVTITSCTAKWVRKDKRLISMN